MHKPYNCWNINLTKYNNRGCCLSNITNRITFVVISLTNYSIGLAWLGASRTEVVGAVDELRYVNIARPTWH